MGLGHFSLHVPWGLVGPNDSSHQAPWCNSVLSSSTQVPCGLARLSLFSPQGTPGTGGTQLFQPMEWWDSVVSRHLVPWGLVEHSHFSPLGTLETGSSKMTRTVESLTESKGLVLVRSRRLQNARFSRTSPSLYNVIVSVPLVGPFTASYTDTAA